MTGGKYSDNDYDRSLVDRYLKILNEDCDEKPSFTDKQLIMTLVDFMFPALSAVPSALVYAIKLVMHNPRVQKKVQEEIDRIVGTGRLVTWEDRKKYSLRDIFVMKYLRTCILIKKM